MIDWVYDPTVVNKKYLQWSFESQRKLEKNNIVFCFCNI
jgi:hypothetical protein